MDVSGCDKVTALKQQMMDLNIAECQHILTHLQHHRDDLLICFSLPYSWFDMDVAHFKVFKEWLLANQAIDLESIIKEVFAAAPEAVEQLKSIPLEQVLAKSSPGDEEAESEGASDESSSAEAAEE